MRNPDSPQYQRSFNTPTAMQEYNKDFGNEDNEAVEVNSKQPYNRIP